jgi:hypothetical protein
MHIRLAETLANIAHTAGFVDYAPSDSRDIATDCIAWAQEFETWFTDAVSAGALDEDAYIEEVDEFARRKLEEQQHNCRRWSETFGNNRALFDRPNTAR